MKILTDNQKVENNITTQKCPVIGDGTVLLLPSQVNKYLGSYLKHKIIGVGILIAPRKLLDVVFKEKINGIEWLSIIYNDKYYYTPAEYMDTSKVVNLTNELHSNTIDTNISTFSLNRNVSKNNASYNISRKEEYERFSGPYTKEDYYILTALKDIDLYNYPSPDSVISNKIKAGEVFVISSLWKNNVYNNKWFSTSCKNHNDALYGLYIDNNNAKIEHIKTGSRYYSIIYKSSTVCKYTDGNIYANLVRGDLTWVSFQNWDTGMHVNVADKNGGGIVDYIYSAKDAAPLADSSDMINKNYLGELSIKKLCVAYDMHRKQNATANNKSNCVDSISIDSLKKEITRDNSISEIMDCGFKFNNSNEVISYFTKNNLSEVNASILSPGIAYIVTNYVFINGSHYYVCFNPTSDKNGAIFYFLIKDEGDEFINYNKYPPVGIDYNTNIPNNNSGISNWVEDLDIDNGSVNKDNSNNTDPTTITEVGEIQQEKIYNTHLGVYDSSPYKVPGIMENAGTTPPEFNGYSILTDVQDYNLSAEMPYDTKHLTHINRFHLPTGNSGLSTKSFIFVTRPDLNLYHELSIDSIDPWAMNPDLKRLPGFKYIARLKGTPESPGIGTKIMQSLEYIGTRNSIDTPWLSVLSNQCNGYSPVDREMDITEMAETFHGNKVIYAEPTFKHKIGGTVSIPFTERRDLTLYFTLRMWIEYIQALSLGYCSPRSTHRKNGILDYAVSLFYITTDETMENILYWEKLTGLIPLTVPDSFFDWSEGNSAREMKYNINFAYSFRTVMDELHLAEINNLYNKNYTDNSTSNATSMPIVPNDYFSYSNDIKNNKMLANVAAFYGELTGSESEYNSFVNNSSLLDKYYYGGIINENQSSITNRHVVYGSNDGQSTDAAQAKFLPNYNMYTGMYGIPYVKGPFIEHDPKAQKYKLRWV